MANWLPRIDYPDLSRDRLEIVADLMIGARDGVASDHKPDTGESSWSAGVRSYERTEVALINAQPKYEWLRVVTGADAGPSMFVFKIGLHPIRFLHGTPDDIPAKYEKPVLPEIAEMQHALALDAALPQNRILRICVETDPQTMKATRVTLAELNKKTGELLNEFLIRGVTIVTHPAPVVPFAPIATAPDGVVMKAPDVTLKASKKKEESQ
jgi:hypothetical protein